jgi:hypothetical protein
MEVTLLLMKADGAYGDLDKCLPALLPLSSHTSCLQLGYLEADQSNRVETVDRAL